MRSMRVRMFVSEGLLALSAATLAADTSTPQAVIEAAIRAHGGQERLRKTERMTRQARGIMSFSGQEVPFMDEMVLQLPRRWRWTLDAGSAGQKARLVLVVNGDQGWQASNGTVLELSKEKLAELHEEAYVLWLSSLLPLVQDSGFTLTALADAEVERRPAARIQVAHQGHPALTLYFDKQSGLLVKIARRAKMAGLTVDKEYLFSAHRSFAGVLLPTRYAELANGKKLVDVADISYKFLRAVEDRTFARP